ncbi:MAG: 3-phosphoshikimate 1-carboxyvinyltransferase [Dermabacter sp.]|nr:3-phosphoshikimate 1-carboxyvinyltransferase [Dermabacter sp.]
MTDVQWSAPVAHGPIDAHVSIPGSKSLTNRWLVLAALAAAPTRLIGALASRDSRLMIDALSQLGARFEADGEALVVHPLAAPEADAGPLEVHCGLAGTVMRFVPALAALSGRRVTFTGDAGALVRPMAPLLSALDQQGVSVAFHGREGYLPFTVHGPGALPGGLVSIDASASSQFVSGLLMAGVRAASPLTVRHVGADLPSLPHIAMTLALLNEVGVQTSHTVIDGVHEWTVHPIAFTVGDIVVEPDLSNAGPFLAAAMVAGGTVSIAHWPHTTTQPGDEFRRILPLMGASVERVGDDMELTGTGTLRGIDIDLSAVGELTPTIAALAALADSPSHLRGIKHLRGHETDRVHALAVELGKLGARVVEHEGSLEIDPAPLGATVFETYEDHRMATAAAIIGLRVPNMRVVNVATTQKTIPDFVGMWMSMLHTEKLAGQTW